MNESSSTSMKGKNIAVIGSGISGMSCAYLLSSSHRVSLFEAGDYLGGHTATKVVNLGGESVAIDTGFIVFNDRTYPNFIRLLGELGVAYQPTKMGFSVSDLTSGYEYAGTSLSGLFAQPGNLLRSSHWRMLRDILRFNRQCTELFHSNNIPELSLGDYLDNQGFSQSFSRHYILPMVSAIWSSGMDEAAEMPLIFFVRFFHNHGLLTVTQQPQWYTILGGSHSYIEPLTKNFKERSYLRCPVTKVVRNRGKAVVTSLGFGDQVFDEVVFACHSDQVLKVLQDPSPAEIEVLSSITYRESDVVLHWDESMLPKARAAWASWNYRIGAQGVNQSECKLTYNMNILQNISSQFTFCVSVNPANDIAPEKVLGSYKYSHPQFTRNSVAAQQRWGEISGQNSTHFCGAYWRNGFHEDGLLSAIAVAKSLGVNW